MQYIISSKLCSLKTSSHSWDYILSSDDNRSQNTPPHKIKFVKMNVK